jgi:hypothetical protein
MKKSKLLILGLIALMLAGGLALASCTDPTCEGDCGKDFGNQKTCASNSKECSGTSSCTKANGPSGCYN